MIDKQIDLHKKNNREAQGNIVQRTNHQEHTAQQLPVERRDNNKEFLQQVFNFKNFCVMISLTLIGDVIKRYFQRRYLNKDLQEVNDVPESNFSKDVIILITGSIVIIDKVLKILNLASYINHENVRETNNTPANTSSSQSRC